MAGLPVLMGNEGEKLTKMQQAFVDALVSNGGHPENAALEAGYSAKTARVQAYELLGKSHVMNAFQLRLALELSVKAPEAMQTLTSLMTSSRSEYVRLQAAQDVLDRIGMRASEKVDHRVGGDVRVSIDLG